MTDRAQPVASPLERGREAHARQAWLAAFDSLAEADEQSALGPEDLELLATATLMLARDDAAIAPGNGITMAPRPTAAISVSSRLRRVSSRFALTTHQMAALRYDGACAWKKSQAAWLARNCLS